MAASTLEIKTGQCEARKGERTRGRWVMSDEDVWGCGQVDMSGGTVIGTCRGRYILSLHGTEGKVALQSRFSFVCTHQFFASSREFFYF